MSLEEVAYSEEFRHLLGSKGDWFGSGRLPEFHHRLSHSVGDVEELMFAILTEVITLLAMPDVGTRENTIKDDGVQIPNCVPEISGPNSESRA